MNDEAVKYNGRIVPKAGFRAYVYDKDSNKKLTNSWGEFEAHVSTSMWFSDKADIPKIVKKKRVTNGNSSRVRNAIVPTD